MLRPVPPMSNSERQRKFRASHPGYFNKYNGRRRTIAKNAKARVIAMLRAQAAEANIATVAPAIFTIPVPTVRLALPAPAIDLTLLAINELAQRHARAQPIAPSATIPVARP